MLQIICGICGKESGAFPKTDEEFKGLIPDGWFTVKTPLELTNPNDLDCNPDPVPYRVCSIRCLHKMEQVLQGLKEKKLNG